MHIWHFEVPASPSHAVEMLSEPHTSICEKMEICGRGSENVRLIWEVDGKNFKEIWWKALKEIWVHAMNLRWKNWHVGGHEGGGWRPLWQLQPWLEISLAIRCLRWAICVKKNFRRYWLLFQYTLPHLPSLLRILNSRNGLSWIAFYEKAMQWTEIPWQVVQIKDGHLGSVKFKVQWATVWMEEYMCCLVEEYIYGGFRVFQHRGKSPINRTAAAAVVGKKPSHVAACYVVAPSTVSGSLASGWSFRWLHIAILTTFSSGRWAMGMHSSVLLVASMPDPATTAFGSLVAGLLALGYARLYW